MADRVDVPSEPGFSEVFRSRDGIVGRDLSARATRVQLAAKSQAGVRTGLLRRDITKNWTTTSGADLAIRIGSSRRYALVHHDGSSPHVIRPRSAKALRWVNADGDVVFARSVQHPGTRANRYLSDNLPLAVR
jgi:hypothetical protein